MYRFVRYKYRFVGSEWFEPWDLFTPSTPGNGNGVRCFSATGGWKDEGKGQDEVFRKFGSGFEVVFPMSNEIVRVLMAKAMFERLEVLVPLLQKPWKTFAKTFFQLLRQSRKCWIKDMMPCCCPSRHTDGLPPPGF